MFPSVVNVVFLVCVAPGVSASAVLPLAIASLLLSLLRRFTADFQI